MTEKTNYEKALNMYNYMRSEYEKGYDGEHPYEVVSIGVPDDMRILATLAVADELRQLRELLDSVTISMVNEEGKVIDRAVRVQK
jgi:hypothetical protein